MIYRSRLVGWGGFLPARVVTNAELAQRVDTTDEWIVQRTGIRQRHIAEEGQLTSDLALGAARKAMAVAGKTADEIDLVIVATTTPDETFPATATKVQAALGMTRGAAFDVQAVCAGFIYALAVADNFIKAGQARNVLVIGAETFSRILDWEDRSTCVLFGDGAGAVLLTAEQAEGKPGDRGLLSTHLHSDGREHDALYVDGGPSSTRTVGHVRMVGQHVYKHAVTKLGAVIEEALEANGLNASDIDWLVPHQANKRIIDSMRQRFGLDEDKVVLCIDRHANTSAASVPLALAEAMEDGRIKQGDLVVLEAIGGGLAWGAGLLRV
ncbi:MULTISPECIES: beta-ketoacyl-ACP synthase III [Oceanibaculum]|uniref:Beta-ketoacyl-[acyl-carrier-protein] synthase III n=1 Tax=Oceanibaculum indicum TaxID=526216 RepID=A0A420WQ91_9PROT|nr:MULTISPECIES: beta-ketoacyl-ACP synthase III [Oceanibaculum]MCH2395175.1 ketoacyl-ACP synthase III [Oceanibaculum sp.]RKQ73208.1 3-oxoacyl-[acyl-carrier-protein] synthase-3 [Oceanibaculum indicum]